MADSAHVQILKAGRDTWNVWRQQHPALRPDLSGANLIGSDLSGYDLFKANLTKANLTKANLEGASFFCADLRKACLLKANLRGTNFHGAKLDHASLHESITDDATSFNRKWQLVWKIVNRPETIESVAGRDLSNANLFKARLVNVDLGDADLSGCNLTQADFSRANLENANLGDANLTGADVSQAKMCGARLTGADVKDLRNWKEIRGMASAVLENVKNAEARFLKWARTQGGVDVEPNSRTISSSVA